MSSSKEIKEIIKEENPDAVFLESPFDNALIGAGRKTESFIYTAVYDSSKCIQILMDYFHIEESEVYNHFCQMIIELGEDKNNPVFINIFIDMKNPEEIFKKRQTIQQGFTIGDIANLL